LKLIDVQLQPAFGGYAHAFPITAARKVPHQRWERIWLRQGPGMQ
jgi:hypothetical protein